MIIPGGSSQDEVIFVRANESGRVLAGNFGFEFPQLAGLENNTNSYVIGDAQWLLDLKAEFNNKYGETGDYQFNQAQQWLRETVYPLVDPFRKALAGSNELSYELLDEDGTLFGLRYNNEGLECGVPDASPAGCEDNNLVSHSIPSSPMEPSLAGSVAEVYSTGFPFLCIMGMTMLLRLPFFRQKRR